MSKGERLFEEQRFFEARTVFEDGLQKLLNGKPSSGDTDVIEAFRIKISKANMALAELNLEMAQHAFTLGNNDKAIEHIELAKSLTDDMSLLEKTEKLLKSIIENNNKINILTPSAKACHSCSSSESEMQVKSDSEEPNLSPMDYYDLLIRQLPEKMYEKYTELGEGFAYFYLAASNDEYDEALKQLDNWFDGTSRDIYCYEKGMILYRIGKAREAEKCLLDAIRENAANPLPYLGLAQLLIDEERLDEAATHLETMVVKGILPEQSLFLRADVSERSGDLEDAIERYAVLLRTPFARAAAEKLYCILSHLDRQEEAASIFKRYLKGCRH